MMRFLKKLFKYNNVDLSSLHQMTKDYFALQMGLLELETIASAITKKTLFGWTTTNDYKLQKKIIYRQIRDYDKKLWVLKVWSWLKGTNKLVEVKRKWLAYQSYKKLLRGIDYPEPILALSEQKLSYFVKVRLHIPLKLKSLLDNFSQSLQRFSVNQLTLKSKLNAALYILNSGKNIMVAQRPVPARLSLRGTHQTVNSNEMGKLRSAIHQFYFLIGIFNLNTKNLNVEQIHQRYSEFLDILKQFNNVRNYIEIESFYLKFVRMYKYLNQHDKQKLCSVIKSAESESLNTARIHGLKLRTQYIQYITGTMSIKLEDMSKDQVTTITSDALVTLRQNTCIPELSSSEEIVNDKKLIANFIKACGFYGVKLDNSPLDKLTKAHRAMQIQIHPDKINRHFECKGEHIPIESSQDSYIKMRNELFDRLNSFFNLKYYTNKKINFNKFQKHEIFAYFRMGKDARNEFDSNIKTAESQNELTIVFDKFKLHTKNHIQYMKIMKEINREQDNRSNEIKALRKTFDDGFSEIRNMINTIQYTEAQPTRFCTTDSIAKAGEKLIQGKSNFFTESQSAKFIDDKKESGFLRRKSI
jgi:hypothetical protein